MRNTTRIPRAHYVIKRALPFQLSSFVLNYNRLTAIIIILFYSQAEYMQKRLMAYIYVCAESQ